MTWRTTCDLTVWRHASYSFILHLDKLQERKSNHAQTISINDAINQNPPGIFFLNIQHSLLSASLINAESLANDSVIIIIASVVPFEASAHFSCIWPQNQFEL